MHCDTFYPHGENREHRSILIIPICAHMWERAMRVILAKLATWDENSVRDCVNLSHSRSPKQTEWERMRFRTLGRVLTHGRGNPKRNRSRPIAVSSQA